MKRSLPIGLTVVTLLLLAVAWMQAGGFARHKMFSAATPEEAVQALMADIQARNWDGAYVRLDPSNDVEKSDFIRDIAGSDGSLRTYAALQSFDMWPLHADENRAILRVRLKWSTAVGSLDDVRDLPVRRDGSIWRVLWPKPNFASVPPQVIPVNYLRWDVVGRENGQAWGAQSVDSPQVRILSMNAVERPGRVVVMGEIENEDTVPACINVNATLLKADGSAIDEESSFDLISHTLLPKQVSPYRIDFPGIRIAQVKSVRMDARPQLVPASADPVIMVADQAVSPDGLGRKVLKGNLINQSGETVNISQVLATFYDFAGKVIWVSGGYVDQALLPQVTTPFALDVPDDVVSRMKNYHVVVNHYVRTSS
ncbi:MAG: hypothetical protein WB952_01620 [Terriglobales bacterium]